MSEEDKSPGIRVDARSISFVLAIITLVSLLFGAISTVNGYMYRVDTLEKRNVELTTQLQTLAETIQELSGTIVELRISITKLEVTRK